VLERLRVADGAVELGEKSRDLPVRVLLVAGEPGVVRQLRALGLDVHEPSDIGDRLPDRLVRDQGILRPLRLDGRSDGGLRRARRRLLGARRTGAQEGAGEPGGGDKAERRSSGGHGALRFVRWRTIAAG
jgi:hypothetical protein